MARIRNFFRWPRPISVALQAQRLRSAFPSTIIKLQKGRLEWTGSLRPTPLSQNYLVQMEYAVGKRPDVRVLEPALVTRSGQRIPHMFPGNKLCLFRHWYREWSSMMFITDTIIPWTTLWLYHYEIWLATGKWSGSKSHEIGVQ
jgi:hypothetical protein